MTSPFFVSAPGKVIIFGEHSAVYGKPAIAAALSLRAYLLVTPSKDPNEIRLDFPDIKLSHAWNKNDIPWDRLRPYISRNEDGKPQVTEELIPEVSSELNELLSDLDSSLHYIACHCFLYLYTQLCHSDLPGLSFCVRSTLPIGAGLGSSASTAVCLASALAVLGGHVAHASLGRNDKVKNHNPDADFIDAWSLMGEKCFHGNPSGIDNAVATYGGAVLYQRMKNPSTPSVRINMRNLPPIKLLLTNTKVPRSTAELVAGVAKINEAYSKTSSSILEAMEHLANDAYQIMIRPFFGKEEREQLRQLVNINHGLLVAIGVSHPALEHIKIIGDRNNLGATKLTGAGGGGCAITLVNDDTTEETVQKVVKEFEQEGYETYETTLGGKGVASLQFDSVPDASVFSLEKFANFKDRFEIDNALSVENLAGWKFW